MAIAIRRCLSTAVPMNTAISHHSEFTYEVSLRSCMNPQDNATLSIGVSITHGLVGKLKQCDWLNFERFSDDAVQLDGELGSWRYD